jgi:hypothetical protein
VALTRNKDPRANKLAALATHYGIAIRTTIDDCRSSAEEDLFFHLFHGEDGEEAEPINRWCAVTAAGEGTFLYPLYADREDAEARTVEYPADDIFSESPVAIVDLDDDAETMDGARMGLIYPLVKLVAVFQS